MQIPFGLADEMTDASQTEQLSLSVQFIKDTKVHEEFLCFVPVSSTTAKDLAFFSPNYLNLGLIWNICVAKVMMAQVIWTENIVVSGLE